MMLQHRVWSILAALVFVMVPPVFNESCPIQIKRVNCTDKDKAVLEYVCESKLHNNCSCTFENPLQSEVGFFKTCRSKYYLNARKKKIHKRQATEQNLCGTIKPPQPGKVSCSVTRTSIQCVGSCDPDYQYADRSEKKIHSCQYYDGIWQPDSTFPPCEPKCMPPCENDGECSSVNFCSCSNEFRGHRCQYPISLCGFSKNRFASNWKCNHTTTETSCDISCHAPGTIEAEIDSLRYECSIQGVWSPSLPPCVHVTHCPEPKSIQHGRWTIEIGNHFRVGSKVSYTCHDKFLLQGSKHLTCTSNGTWSNEFPVCVEQMSLFCEDPGDVPYGFRNVSVEGYGAGTHVSYGCNENFTLLGNPAIECLSNGKWSSIKPQCVPRQLVPAFCSKPNAPKNSVAVVTFPGQQPLQTVFNKDIPIAQRLYVINFARGQDTEFSNMPQGTFVIGTRVQYRCKSRFYKLYGSEYQTCLSSKTWSGYQPACVPECGRSDSPKTPFIVNGNSSRIGQWPWQVGIAIKTPRGLQMLCGGVLISELWVLTAAHCVAKKLTNIPVSSRDLLVFCGKFYRSFEMDDEYVQVKQVRQVIIHEEYDFVHFDGDIALIQLEEAVELTTRVQPVCLPTEDTTRENLRDGKMGIVIGWGLTENGKFSEMLKETVLPVVSHDKCEEVYREGLRSVTITKNMFCAGHESGQSDTCNGDSGGPFMFSFGPANDYRWYLEGIVSWGSESGCSKALRYSGFTKVGRFVPWIKMFI